MPSRMKNEQVIEEIMEEIKDDAHKLRLVSMHKNFVKRFGENMTWDEYERKIKLRFDLVFEDPMVEQKNLKQTTSVQGQMWKKMLILLLSKEGVVSTFHNSVDKQPLISLNALNGMNTYRTMRVKGCMGRNVLHVLVDSGSTHNFLDLQVAKKLGCRLRKICPLDVSVANGNVMFSTYECTLLWETYSVISKPWSWNLLIKIELSAMSVCVYPATLLKLEMNDSIPKPISEVLEAYESVFEVPKELPPKRSHDHTIPLIPNTPPISIRPYRHPPN
ncbi:hypothetical protein Tco_0309669 [Tanacetum coccineum]